MNDEREKIELPKLNPNWWNEPPEEASPGPEPSGETPPLRQEPEAPAPEPEEAVPVPVPDEAAESAPEESELKAVPPEEPEPEPEPTSEPEPDSRPAWRPVPEPEPELVGEDVDDAEVWNQLPPIGSTRKKVPRKQPPPPRTRRQSRKDARQREKKLAAMRSAPPRPGQRSPSRPRRERLEDTRVSRGKGKRENRLLRRLKRVDVQLVLILLLILMAAALIVVGVLFYRSTTRQSNADRGFRDSDVWSPQQEKETQTLPRYDGDSADVMLTLSSKEDRKPLSYQKLYKKCAPSVVSIVVKNDKGKSSGTGIIMTKDGYIITCAHVVYNQKTATVTTADGRNYPASLVGSDPQTDLALLKIEAEKLTPAEFGNAKELQVGDQAFAIGDPLGPTFRATITNGIISAINRDVTMNGYAMTLIQTNAALNSGNSGGPLINLFGQVVGINNMKMVSTNTTVEGLGFAVPSTTAKEIIEALARDGGITRPVLGVTCYGVDEVTAQENGTMAGLVVSQVNKRSDCAKAGVRPGDLIAAVDGKTYTNVSVFKKAYKKARIDQKVVLTLYRPRSDKDAKWSATHPGEPPERPIEYQSIGKITVKLMNQQDLT